MTIKRSLFRDVLREHNSRRFSMTKLASLTSLILLISASATAIGIMISSKTIDHIFIGEIIALLLTLLGFKNFKGNFSTGADIKKKNNDALNEDDLDSIG